MKIIAFVGHSNSGKTQLITRLVPELKKRGLNVAVIKRCTHGFDLGGEDKDSSKFLAAGADGVALAAPGQTAILHRTDCPDDIATLAQKEFSTADMVLVEGGKNEAGLRKIEVIRAGLSAGIETPFQDLDAVVADHPEVGSIRTFQHDEITGLADWLAGGVQR